MPLYLMPWGSSGGGHSTCVTGDPPIEGKTSAAMEKKALPPNRAATSSRATSACREWIE